MESLAPQPHLVCLNLQQDMIALSEHNTALAALLWRMRSCLYWARSHDVPIIHAHSVTRYAPAPPIPAFEVLPCEIIIAKRSLSAFGADEWRRSMAAGCSRVLLLGLSRDCDLAATALDGVARGVQVVLVSDAIGLERSSAALGPNALRDLLAPAIPSITTSELVERRGLSISN